MADTNRQATQLVAMREELTKSAARFDFFAAVRWLDCIYEATARTGYCTHPSGEPIRLAQDVSLAFPQSSLTGWQLDDGSFPPRLMVNFLGLLGAMGPLPLHLSDFAFERQRHHGDRTFARFLDVFNHRMIAFFYRAWADTRPTISFDRSDSDRFSQYVGALFGLGMDSLRDRDAMPDLAKLHYAGRFACQTRNAEGLQAMLADMLGLPVKIEEFVGQWIRLPDDCRCQMGVRPASATLGESAVVGSHVYDCQQKFRVIIGPVDLDNYLRLLPGGESLRRLTAVVKNYIGDELDWDVNVILQRQEIPATCLGTAGQLGWTNWVSTESADTDSRDLQLDDLPRLYNAM